MHITLQLPSATASSQESIKSAQPHERKEVMSIHRINKKDTKLETDETDVPVDKKGRPLIRRGTIYLTENVQLSGIPFARQNTWTGDVVMDPVNYVPLGIWIRIKREQEDHHKAIDRHWIPANSGAALAITIKKTPEMMLDEATRPKAVEA